MRAAVLSYWCMLAHDGVNPSDLGTPLDAGVTAAETEAMAYYLALGTTSLTNPVLDFALQTFLQPLGVTGDWLEFDVSSIPYSASPPRLFRPFFSPQLIDPKLTFSEVLVPLRDNVGQYQARVSIFGVMTIEISPQATLLAKDISARLAVSAAKMPGLTQEAAGQLHRFLLDLAGALVGEDAWSRDLQAVLARRDPLQFAAGLLRGRGLPRPRQ